MKQKLEALTALWQQERATERERVVERRLNRTLAQRVEYGDALTRLEVLDTSASSGDRTVLWVEPESLENFRASSGAPVLLWWDAPEPDTSLRAVLRRRGRRLGLVVDDFPERVLTGVFNLDLESPETTFDRGARALRIFGDAKPASDLGRIARAAFGDLRNETIPFSIESFFDPDLNAPQRDAVAHALATEPLSLIHGPPGTGKTRTLVEVVRQAVARGQRVLITAASNAAVDNLAERLLERDVDVVRLGHPARVAPAVEAATLDARLESRPDFALAKGWMDEANALRRRIFARSDRGTMNRAERRDGFREARQLMRDARTHLRNIEDAIVSNARVVASTASGADSRILWDQEFDLVVVDEATQAADPIVLVGLQRAPRAILAGDPHQLPPTILDVQAARAGLGTTIFERLAESASLLEIQHRMHQDIMRFPSESKYQERLSAAPSVAEHRLEDLGVAPDPLRPGPFVFVDTAGKGWDDESDEQDPSTRNPMQAERTAAEVRRLLSRGVAAQDVAVITPYYAQVRILRRLLMDTDVEIDTVDAFQGREKEAIVVDLVRSNASAQLGFLNDTRRMNVALTRARRMLLVIGDSATLGGHPYFADFLSAAEAHGTWVSAWADDADLL